MAGFVEGLKNFGQGAKDFLVGTPGRTEQFQRFTPQQQGINTQLLDMLPGLLQRGTQGFQGGFAPIANEPVVNFSHRLFRLSPKDSPPLVVARTLAPSRVPWVKLELDWKRVWLVLNQNIISHKAANNSNYY